MKLIRLALCVILLSACTQTSSLAVQTTVAVTHVASLNTPTPSRVPPTATVTTTPTATTTPTLTPSPTPKLVPVVQLMAVGDVMLGDQTGERIRAEGPGVPFAGVASVFDSADLLVANLECVISERGQAQPKAYTFRAPPDAADSLAMAGVDVVGLANNHSLDFGFEALSDTLQLLSDRQIGWAGAGVSQAAARAPVIVERNGLRVAFLAYVDVPVETRSRFDTRAWIATETAPGVAWAEVDDISADVASAQLQADVVVVLLHFGLEGRSSTTSAQAAQAHAAIDAGAALVLGSHPHVLQRAEPYQGGLIVYSLGNFVFEGFTFPENYSAIFTATLTPDGVGEYDWIPVVVEGGFPRLATPDEAPGILERVQPSS